MSEYILSGEFSEQFLIALAMAIHCKVTNPTEVKWLLDNGWSQRDVAVELFKKVKASRV